MNFVTFVKMATAIGDIYELSKALEDPKFLPEFWSLETHHNLKGQCSYVPSWMYMGKLRQNLLESFSGQQQVSVLLKGTSSLSLPTPPT